MADDKIVTKKTATKKTAQKKAADPKPAVGHATATATKPAASSPSARKTTAPAATAKKAPAEKAVSNATVTKTTEAAKSAAKRVANDSSVSLKGIANVSVEARQKMIADAAYFKAEKRHRESTPEERAQDWIEAEHEIDDLINRAKTMTST